MRCSMSEEQLTQLLGLPAHERAPLPDEEEERFLWYIANHYLLDADLFKDSEWTGGVNCN